MQFTKKLLMEIQWILFKILFRAVDWLHAARSALLQLQFFTSESLLYDFVFVLLSCSVAGLLSCSVAQLLNCVQRQSKTPAVNHGHGENKSRSPDTGGVHSTADDRTLIKNGCTEHRELGTGTQPSPAQPGQTRRLFTRSLHGQTKSQAQRCQWQEAGAPPVAGGTGIWWTEERVLLARLLIYVRMRAALAPYSGAP